MYPKDLNLPGKMWRIRTSGYNIMPLIHKETNIRWTSKIFLPSIGTLKGLLSSLRINASCDDRLEVGEPIGNENPKKVQPFFTSKHLLIFK